MRKIVGIVLVLYSLLLGFSLSLPLVASIAGPKVTAIVAADPATCSSAIGFAPLAGFPQRCDVTWTTEKGPASGTLYGKAVDSLVGGVNKPKLAVHQLGNFAFTTPVGNAQLMMAFLAPPILFLGLHALARKRRRRHRGGGLDLDFDDDDSDSADSGGGDSDSGD
ncbi:hypothetical protein [Catellatospora methionotrophica]|uniref:hypothetical protein n=1 Tax=Catellatospora methionotrophica TaxID=121620 RepID=UPI0033D84C32